MIRMLRPAANPPGAPRAAVSRSQMHAPGGDAGTDARPPASRQTLGGAANSWPPPRSPWPRGPAPVGPASGPRPGRAGVRIVGFRARPPVLDGEDDAPTLGATAPGAIGGMGLETEL